MSGSDVRSWGIEEVQAWLLQQGVHVAKPEASGASGRVLGEVVSHSFQSSKEMPIHFVIGGEVLRMIFNRTLRVATKMLLCEIKHKFQYSFTVSFF